MANNRAGRSDALIDEGIATAAYSARKGDRGRRADLCGNSVAVRRDGHLFHFCDPLSGSQISAACQTAALFLPGGGVSCRRETPLRKRANG